MMIAPVIFVALQKAVSLLASEPPIPVAEDADFVAFPIWAVLVLVLAFPMLQTADLR